MKSEKDEFLWRQFIKLGDMMGDGLHHEEPWIAKEYKKLAKVLCPPSPEEVKIAKELRQQKNARIDSQMANLLKERYCSCGGEIKQVRSGSKVAQCDRCKAIFKAKKRKQKPE